MLLNENLVAFVKIHLKIQSLQGTCPFTLSPDQLLIENSASKIKSEYFKTVLSTLCVLVLWIQLILEKDNESLNIWMQSYVYIVSLSVFCFSKWVLLNERNMFVEFFNVTMQFERQNFTTEKLSQYSPNSHSQRKTEAWLMKFIFLCGIVLGGMIGPPYIAMRWMWPCNSATFGFYAIAECKNPTESQGWKGSSIWLLFFICLLMFWLFIDGIGSWSVACVAFSNVPAYCLHRYLKQIEILLEISNSPSKLEACIRMYKQVQILSRFYNLLQQDALVICHIFFLLNAIIICLFMLVSLGVKISLPELALFGTGAQDAVTGLVLYSTCMAKVYSDSKSVKLKLKEPTPLTLLNFCSGRIVELLLM